MVDDRKARIWFLISFSVETKENGILLFPVRLKRYCGKAAATKVAAAAALCNNRARSSSSSSGGGGNERRVAVEPKEEHEVVAEWVADDHTLARRIQ